MTNYRIYAKSFVDPEKEVVIYSDRPVTFKINEEGVLYAYYGKLGKRYKLKAEQLIRIE